MNPTPSDGAPVLHIACACDAAYVPECAALLHSLATHHRPERLLVHFLHDDDLDAGMVHELGSFAATLGLGWAEHPVPETSRKSFPDHPRYGRVAWYRVLLPTLLPGERRVLYLDCDTIATAPLDELWAVDLEGAPLAAVTNPLYPGNATSFLEDLGVPKEMYFNSGVLLLDLDAWRRRGVADQVLEVVALDRHGWWPDQNALNAVLWAERRPLPPRWNAQNTIFELPDRLLPFDRDDLHRARRSPAIVHFIGPYKPWHHRSKHPWRARWFEHHRSTPWADRPPPSVSVIDRALRLLPAGLAVRLEIRAQPVIARTRRVTLRGPRIVGRLVRFCGRLLRTTRSDRGSRSSVEGGRDG